MSSGILVLKQKSTSFATKEFDKVDDGRYRLRKPKIIMKVEDYKTESYIINFKHQNTKFSYNEMQIKLNRGFNYFTRDKTC